MSTLDTLAAAFEDCGICAEVSLDSEEQCSIQIWLPRGTPLYPVPSLALLI